MTPETPMRMLERMIKEVETTKEKVLEIIYEHHKVVFPMNMNSWGDAVKAITCKICEPRIMLVGALEQEIKHLTLLRDKFQQAGKEMLDHRQRVVEATVSGRPCEDRQKGLVLGIDRSLRAFGFAEAEGEGNRAVAGG